MSSDYIRKEVEKIIKDEKLAFPKNLAMASAWLLGNLKGLNLKIYDVQGKSALADYFVIASATNTTQAHAMSESIMKYMSKFGYRTKSCEGQNDADWILLDLGDIIVHIFLENSRPIYDLDNLWADSENIEIPASYYFKTPDTETTKKESSDKDYF